jgi:hypothetical protein
LRLGRTPPRITATANINFAAKLYRYDFSLSVPSSVFICVHLW